MHLVRIALVALTFAACKKSSPQQAIPSPVPSPVIATTASAPATDDAGAEESLELVATADPGSAIAFSTDQLWIHGKRIHVMFKNGDAIGPDLLKGLPVDPSKHTRLAGAPLTSFAFRRNDVPCGEVDDPLLFVQRGDK